VQAIEYAAPSTVTEAVQLLQRGGPSARVLAGGTDIIVMAREFRRDVSMMIDVKKIAELTEISYSPDRGLRLGAAAPCYRIYENEDVKRHYPALVDSASLIGGIQIQSRASIGGNLCNSSPAADSIPTIIALGGVCHIAGPGGERTVPAEEFCTASRPASPWARSRQPRCWCQRQARRSPAQTSRRKPGGRRSRRCKQPPNPSPICAARSRSAAIWPAC
jgi:xanthine dehydrogenase FAD-binding subunit